MSVGSLYSPPSQQQIGTASAQPLGIVTQYRRQRIEGDLEAFKEAYDAGDSASYVPLATDIKNQLPQSGLDQNVQARLANDTVNPGPSSLAADIIYMKALDIPDSVLGPATKSTYTSDDLSALNNQGNTSGLGSANGPGGYPTPPASPNLGPTSYGAPPPSMNNLPSFATPSGS